MISIAIIDVLGLTYDGTTLEKRGLGGSESAIILMARELAKVGFNVTVFNNCIDSQSDEGVYDGVKYIDLANINASPQNYDIVISSRTVVPFLPEHLWSQFQYNPSAFKQIKQNAKLKIMWMHDTFCTGDHLLEDMLVRGDIDEIFTLSDFHTSYVTTCAHGRKRNFEVLKNKIYMTRNGAVAHNKEIDYSKKDPNLFVYNASVTKGMIPLVTKIWPKLKEKAPDIKLKVIGGYYRFRDGAPPDAQEVKFWQLADDPKNKELGIEFTGIIKQSEIADILASASFMIYPGAFPETFGISSLEALLNNTPIITTRFGALEETAIGGACYLMDYAIEPNSLFPEINHEQQVNQFVDLTLQAYHNRYLHQQKSYYCNIIKDISGWDSVSLQWKQHLYKKLGICLPVDDYRKVSKINFKVQKVFGRRFSNIEELSYPRQSTEQRIVVVSPLYNAQEYVGKCIESVAQQDYDNYHHYIIDDCSTDNTSRIVHETIQKLPEHLRKRFTLITNKENYGAVYNQISLIRDLNDDDVVMLLDGDDWLINDNNVFSYYNNLYDGTTEFTYGSCWSVVDNIPLISQPYPEHIKKSKQYRSHKFNWGIPYTHLRTFKKYLLNNVDDAVFKDLEGNWYKAGGDGSTFYNIIEQADPDKVKVVQDIVYNYNDASPLNDYKVNGALQNRNARQIQQKKQIMKTILIAIPTAKNIEVDTFKSIYDLTVPEGYTTTFQYFYGYNIDQVRNLIADWVVKGFDYLLSVDSDIVLPKDTLVKMLQHDKDLVTGVYIQRKHGAQIPEVYQLNSFGGVTNMSLDQLATNSLTEIAGCGFGCVLVKKEVFAKVGYPQFEYHSAVDHRFTVSEDVDFCRKSRDAGFKLYVDPTIVCDHIGSFVFKPSIPEARPVDNTEQRLRELGSWPLLPKTHIDYLHKLKTDYNFEPKVVYDIGACVLHWTNEAKQVWPDADFVVFEAMEAAEFLYKEKGYKYNIGLLSDRDNRLIDFYENTTHPGGNSYYKENPQINPSASQCFNETHKKTLRSITVDTVMKQKKFPLPDLVKMDVQGAELDVLRGMERSLRKCKHLILELQHVPYNEGAPLKDAVIREVEKMGFKLETPLFSMNKDIDGDYHFIRVD